MAIIPASNPGPKAIALGGNLSCGALNQSIEKELGVGANPNYNPTYTGAISFICTVVRNFLLGSPTGAFSLNCAYGKDTFPGKLIILSVGGGGGGGQFGGGGAGAVSITAGGGIPGGTPYVVAIGAGGANFVAKSPQQPAVGGSSTTITRTLPPAVPAVGTPVQVAGGGGAGAGPNPAGYGPDSGGTSPIYPSCYNPTPTYTYYKGSGGGGAAYAGPGGNPAPIVGAGGASSLTPLFGGTATIGTGFTTQAFIGAGGGGALTKGGNSTLAPYSCQGPSRLSMGSGGNGIQFLDGQYYGGGGGGSFSQVYSNTPTPFTRFPIAYQGSGGLGGGGKGAISYATPTAYCNLCIGSGGGVNTGGGGGGDATSRPICSPNTFSGGSGIAIFIYSSPYQNATGGTVSQVSSLTFSPCTLPQPYVNCQIGAGPYWIHKFTTSGTFTT